MTEKKPIVLKVEWRSKINERRERAGMEWESYFSSFDEQNSVLSSVGSQLDRAGVCLENFSFSLRSLPFSIIKFNRINNTKTISKRLPKKNVHEFISPECLKWIFLLCIKISRNVYPESKLSFYLFYQTYFFTSFHWCLKRQVS